MSTTTYTLDDINMNDWLSYLMEARLCVAQRVPRYLTVTTIRIYDNEFYMDVLDRIHQTHPTSRRLDYYDPMIDRFYYGIMDVSPLPIVLTALLSVSRQLHRTTSQAIRLRGWCQNLTVLPTRPHFPFFRRGCYETFHSSTPIVVQRVLEQRQLSRCCIYIMHKVAVSILHIRNYYFLAEHALDRRH